jgi:hypothetical protein
MFSRGLPHQRTVLLLYTEIAGNPFVDAALTLVIKKDKMILVIVQYFERFNRLLLKMEMF